MNEPDGFEAEFLSWSTTDIEQRVGFRGGKYTSVNNLLTFLLGVALTVCFYGVMYFIRDTTVGAMFTKRGPTPYVMALFFFWSLTILFVKNSKLRLQRKALDIDVIPLANEFVLSPATVQQVLDNTYVATDNPNHFLLFHRIHVALSNLKNIGRVADVDDILRSQADHEESIVETSYSLLRGFVWGIPILGFIGTVMGLSEAIGKFGAVLGETTETSQITTALQGVTSGLSTAFETTLIALVAALVVQMLITFQKKGEEDFLDECTEYCLKNIVNKLRITPYQPVSYTHLTLPTKRIV